MYPSVKRIAKVLGIKRKVAHEIRQAMESMSVEKAIAEISDLLGFFGAEAVFSTSYKMTWPIFEYANNGDSYQPTVVYCHDTGRYYLEGWADRLGKLERRGYKFE